MNGFATYFAGSWIRSANGLDMRVAGWTEVARSVLVSIFSNWEHVALFPELEEPRTGQAI